MIHLNTVSTLLLGLFLLGCWVTPCEAKIAFAGNTGEFWQIWVMDDDGANQQQVTADPEDKRLPVWVTPHTLLYETNQGALFLLDLHTKQATRMAHDLGYVNGADVNGSSLVVAQVRSDIRDVSELLVTGFDGGTPLRLAPRTGMYRSPHWLDGAHLMASVKDGVKPEMIVRIDVQTRQEEALVQGQHAAIFPSVSADHAAMLFASDESGDYEIWLLDLTTRQRRQLTDVPGLDTQPRWAGDEVVFVSTRSGDMAIWTMHADGQAPMPLTAFPSKDPHWIRSP